MTGQIFWREGVAPERPGRITRIFAWTFGHLYLAAVRILDRIFSRARGSVKPLRCSGHIQVLAVGPFYSDNWVAAQLHALGLAPEIQSVIVITPEPYKPLPAVRYYVPSVLSRRLVGMSVARAISTFYLALKEGPDLLIAYHAPWNGMVGLLAARLSNAKAAYFSVGGPAEIIGGGLYSEHALFRRIGNESKSLERKFLRLINRFDAVLTMGSRSASWFKDAGICKPIWIMGAGVDSSTFAACATAKCRESMHWDLVTVARLAPIKRLDLLIQAVGELRNTVPGIQAVIVGDGPEMGRLRTICADLGLESSISLVGFHKDVTSFLNGARLFVMTSASEGLPLAIIEAMLCGLPCIAPAVGDISDLIEDGHNGFLFEPGDLTSCVDAIQRALDTEDVEMMALRAREKALSYTVEARVTVWSRWLKSQNVAVGEPA